MVRRKDGRWQEQIGKKYFYGKTKSEVLRKIADWNQEQEYGRLLSEVVEEWDDQRAKYVEDKKLTYNAYDANQASIKEIIAVFGDRRIKTITAQEVQTFINSIERARRTVQMRLDVLRMIFRHAQVKGDVQDNPCDAVSLPPGLESEEREFPSDKDLEIVKNGLDKPFGLLAYFALFSGLRRGELLALRWDDIDFDKCQIRVSRALYWKNNQPYIKEPKTEAGVRIVPLLDPLKKVLNPGKGYVFPGNDGKPMTKTVIRTRWNNYCRAAGLVEEEKHFKEGKNGRLYCSTKYVNRLGLHQLRHAFATICFDAGLPARDTMDIMGHSSIKVTEDIYTHIRESRRESTAEKLNAYLEETASKKEPKKYRLKGGRL